MDKRAKRLATMRQAAELVGVPYKTLWSAVDKGYIESVAVCIGGPRMVVLDSAKRWKLDRKKGRAK